MLAIRDRLMTRIRVAYRAMFNRIFIRDWDDLLRGSIASCISRKSCVA